MLISDSHKFIFIHIRKSAGGSVKIPLQIYSLPRPSDLFSKVLSKINLEKDYHNFRFRQHATILDVKKIMPLDIFDGYFKFAFVRNPFTRLVSEYEYIRRTHSHGRHKKVLALNSFNDFILYQSTRFDAHQVNMLCDKNGAILMDFIGKFENLEEDWGNVCKKIGLTNIAMPHTKKAETLDYSDYYPQKNIELVQKLWKRDFETFGYSFNFKV
ncbi:sulfotransferase family protein [Paucihalobacter ruber]|uniref:Sulfotransferase family protein n=1 Tax=Paucihalobacter ruber TaxID=2567861 RepID=A0A506PH58_9FLAO|nr:sulfotransferase family 2 domain-containing protein [Paucihalobacter ruber]TPV32858.1 sulfotransferase family protein [Paucihalobacter ruber]